jgi:hypothetical protein
MQIIDIEKGHDDAIPYIIEPTKPKRLSGKTGCGDTICIFLKASAWQF